MQWISYSPKETFELGLHFGETLSSKSLLCTFGDLGSGKTTFLKGMIHGISGIAPEEITSPTFVYFNRYKIKKDKYFAKLCVLNIIVFSRYKMSHHVKEMMQT